MHFLLQLACCFLLLRHRNTSLGSAAALKLDSFTVIDFLQDVRRLHGLDSVLIARNQNATALASFIAAGDSSFDSLARGIVRELPVSVLQMTQLGAFYLRRHLDESLLSVVVLDGTLAQHTGLLQRLATALRHMTQTRLLFLCNHEAANAQDLLRQLFTHCWQQRMINVVALFADYQRTGHYYSYTHFPSYQLEVHSWRNSSSEIYPYRLGNLKGFKLPYVLGGPDPRLIIYPKPNGEQYVGGFAGHLFHAFSKKYNCELVQPVPVKVGELDPAQYLTALVRNGTVEVSAGLTFPTIPIVGFSYPQELMNFCLMIPMEPDIPHYEFYTAVFKLSALFIILSSMVLISLVLSWALYQNGVQPQYLNLFFHPDCWRGVLGQSFTEVAHPSLVVRFIYLQICVLGILLTTTYNSYFAAFVTSAPKQAQLRSLADVLRSNMKVFVWTPEYNELITRVPDLVNYTSMFHQEPDYHNYLRVRDSYDTKYIYLVPTMKRVIINEQQKIFTTPILRQTEDVCVFNTVPMCFPIHENSVFMQTLNTLILETSQAGLTDHWGKAAFYELIAAGKLRFVDLSKKSEFRAMKVEDMRYIWYALGFAYVLSSVVFLGEFCVPYKREIWNVLKRLLRRTLWRCFRVFRADL